jgi:hypothetical protein
LYSLWPLCLNLVSLWPMAAAKSVTSASLAKLSTLSSAHHFHGAVPGSSPSPHCENLSGNLERVSQALVGDLVSISALQMISPTSEMQPRLSGNQRDCFEGILLICGISQIN